MFNRRNKKYVRGVLVIIVLLWSLIAEAEVKPLFITMPICKQKPIVDGKVEPGEYKQAVLLTGFRENKSGNAIHRSPLVYLTYDQERIYCAMQSPLRPGESLKKWVLVKDDDRICKDDAVEFFIRPIRTGGKRDDYFHFVANSRGIYYDARAKSFDWNGRWEYQNNVTDNVWTVEMSLPWTDINIHEIRDGMKLGLDVCRDSELHPYRWTSIAGSYHNTKNLSNIVLSAQGPAVQIESLGNLFAGEVKIKGRVINTSSKAMQLNVVVIVVSSEKKLFEKMLSVSLFPNRTKAILLKGKIKDSIENAILYLKVTDSMGKIYYEQELPFKMGLKDIPVKKPEVPVAIRPVDAIKQLPESMAPVPPEFVNWSFDGAEQRDNGLRGEVTLNGWWRWQLGGKTARKLPDDSAWLYRKVPAQSYNTESFPVRDEKFNVLTETDPRVGKKLLNEVSQWCEREFIVPAKWKGRRLILKVDSLVSGSAIFLNNQLIEALPQFNLGGSYDITDGIRWDRPNRLTIFSSGVDGDVSLVSVPVGPVIKDAWLVSSWRQKSATARLQVSASESEDLQLKIEIFDGDDVKPVKTLKSRQILKTGRNTITFSEKWKNPIPWSLLHPHLYSYRVQMFKKDGTLLDETFPARFGFREIWIEDGDFYLNGRPVHFVSQSNVSLTRASFLGDPAYIRYSLRQWQKAGVNAITLWHGEKRSPTLDPLLHIADEMGIAIFSMTATGTGEHGPEAPESLDYYYKMHREYIERYRQHPSIVGWTIGVGSHNADFCPAVNDGNYNLDTSIATYKYKAIVTKHKAAALKSIWRACGKSDDTRPIFGLSNGDIGSVWTSMAYMGFDVDLQERENWPLRWSRKKHKPIMPFEFSLPYYKDWFARTQVRDAQQQGRPKNTKALVTEYGAMFFGPSAYETEKLLYLKRLQTSRGKLVWSGTYWKVKNLFAEALRAWRAYGISFTHHAEKFFKGQPLLFPKVAKLDPRRRSATPESFWQPGIQGSELSEFGKKVRDATAPLMAFIGGPDRRFTLKDHVYWSGETVKKALVLVNDTDDDVRIVAEWALEGNDAKGVVEIMVPAGQQETQGAVIEFQAPIVKERSDYKLVVLAKTLKGRSISVPAFSLTVFPPKKTDLLKPSPGLILFDPVGETQSALTQLGLKPAQMPDQLTSQHCLIIGRRVLEKREHIQALAKAGFDEAVAKGMRVLIFEQFSRKWSGKLMGLKMKRLDTRRAFIRASGHPAFKGLLDSDFKFLRGDSNLIEAYPGPDSEPKSKNYPIHFWHWGNDNILATYTLEKPQKGTVRALLDCGFDLVETPLMEAARGEGLLIFCQMDVTNRIGIDPVSTRLTKNLLHYLMEGKLDSPASVSLSELLEQHPPSAWIEEYLSPAPELPGIHTGELFFREKLRVPAFDPDSAAPLFTQVKLEKQTDSVSRYWVTSLSVTDLKTDWQKAKLARIKAALKFLNGERSDEGPMMSKFEDRKRLYPYKWNRLPKMDADFDPYVYFRW